MCALGDTPFQTYYDLPLGEQLPSSVAPTLLAPIVDRNAVVAGATYRYVADSDGKVS
jgi:hypothetical protein